MIAKIEEMKDRVKVLNEAAKAYYQENREIMPNIQYDMLYDELADLEKETGITLANSPTIHVGYELLSDLPKEAHEKPMLSLDKTKDREALQSWLGKQAGLLSFKLDGLTTVLSFENGALVKGVTRGNGEIGEKITNNVKVFANVPLTIPYKGNLVLRGESVISYSEFERINSEIMDKEAKYKNPRNLCSGTVRQLNNKITAERNVQFFAFSLVSAEGVDFHNSRMEQLNWLKENGFDVVEWSKVTAADVVKTIGQFEERIENNDVPSDGLVLTFDDIAYGESLGQTSKFPRDAIAFKWKDEIAETQLIEVEWSASRLGSLNPVAIFQSVELEGTSVSRASLHNLSIMEALELGIGDTLQAYKANMIIPQIYENLTRSGTLEIPEHCPVCGAKTIVKQDNDTKVLFCPNEDCPAKHIKLFAHFVGRDAMGMDGLSESTVEKLISCGLVKEYADLFHLDRYKDVIVEMEGFGEKSYAKLIDTVNKARKTNPIRVLYSLAIPNGGHSNSKAICKKFNYQWDAIQAATYDELLQIDGIGDTMASAYVKFFQDEKNQRIVKDLLAEIEFEAQTPAAAETDEQTLEGLTFVITGSVEQFKNRNELKEAIEMKGGCVVDSVTAKTNYLINNDNMSSSSKNKKAKELGVQIITEAEFVEMI